MILVYRELELLWSARLAKPARALRVAKFGEQRGLVISVAVDGALTLSYLGTDPPNSAVATNAKELNYEAMDEEHRRLLQVPISLVCPSACVIMGLCAHRLV